MDEAQVKLNLLSIYSGDLNAAETAFRWVTGTEGAAVSPSAEKPKAAPKKAAAPKGPSIEELQDKVRALVNEPANKSKVKAAIEALGGKRVGDFEGDADKLTKLGAALDALAEPAAEEEEEDFL